ncbi:MAG: hypothetical protein U0003_02665 [Vampirovibrionales bacterium]
MRIESVANKIRIFEEFSAERLALGFTGFLLLPFSNVSFLLALLLYKPFYSWLGFLWLILGIGVTLLCITMIFTECELLIDVEKKTIYRTKRIFNRFVSEEIIVLTDEHYLGWSSPIFNHQGEYLSLRSKSDLKGPSKFKWILYPVLLCHGYWLPYHYKLDQINKLLDESFKTSE